MIDMAEACEIIAVTPHRPGTILLLASSDGRGFRIKTEDILAETRKGRQVMTPRPGQSLQIVHPVAPDEDMIATIGDNRKLLVFPLEDLPLMAKGQGVALQKFKDGGLADARTFIMADGLSWPMGGSTARTRTEADLSFWKAARASAGRLPPTGFPRNNKFA
jgi:topoisomerase-4 subunit A